MQEFGAKFSTGVTTLPDLSGLATNQAELQTQIENCLLAEYALNGSIYISCYYNIIGDNSDWTWILGFATPAVDTLPEGFAAATAVDMSTTVSGLI